ncbi:hypothetical protein P3T76_006661 [Phytophthora citrophthora]|uniref:Uncharacterized protein n=1 Tax=Phytophthora citrophthora TaxID=4793 RepID=A0AAD9GN22_9STRA|nr:hypothetical protein P3T76_006661 [Phytophthora citrophthora]
MPTTLEILRAEREAQDAEDARPPFASVDSLRAFIVDENPALINNVAQEMCWIDSKEYEKFYRPELINRDEQDFPSVVEAFKALDPARSSKCVFVLTIWKNYDGNLNRIDYRPGLSYRLDKVHSLKLNYGNLVGSMQIRERLRVDPLPPLLPLIVNESQDTPSLGKIPAPVMDQASESSSSHTPDEPLWASPQSKAVSQKTGVGRNTGEAKAAASNGSVQRASPAAKIPKRKTPTRSGDEKATPLESPRKRPPGREPKELFPSSEDN